MVEIRYSSFGSAVNSVSDARTLQCTFPRRYGLAGYNYSICGSVQISIRALSWLYQTQLDQGLIYCFGPQEPPGPQLPSHASNTR
jgi:hypothetical protein